MASPSATCFISYSQPQLHCSVSSMESFSSVNQSIYYLLVVFFTIFLLFLSFRVFCLFRRLGKTEEEPESESVISEETSVSTLKLSLSRIIEKTRRARQYNSNHLPHSLHVELLASGSPKWATLFSSARGFGDRIVDGSGFSDVDVLGERQKEEEGDIKRKKKRTKKKKQNQMDAGNFQSEDGGGRKGVEKEGLDVQNKEELVCLYPFTSSSSATQRKIKQQYDELVRSHESKGLTLAQVGRFVNCLVDARNELQQKSEAIQRKFTITKALLIKADRSSFDRLRQQIYKLELEQKRLEEDAFVYNWLQHQLKLSPAYKKMLEIGASMELKAKSGGLMKDREAESTDISFEEFLAQEKKDSFWQKHGKQRSCPS